MLEVWPRVSSSFSARIYYIYIYVYKGTLKQEWGKKLCKGFNITADRKRNEAAV